MDVATWNVLHRIHAENWGDGPIDRFPREADRIAAITARIADHVSTGCRAICLQEVSGDQLASLAAALSPEAQIFVLRYPRVPKPRVAPLATATLADPTEHLVTVIAGDSGVRGVEAMVYADDHGKGYLAVAFGGGGGIVNTHVSFGDKRAGQLREVVAAAARIGRGPRGPIAIVGDFNADRDIVTAAVGDGHALAIPADPALPTRPRPGSTQASKSETIDHVVVCGGRAVACAVVDVDGLSDHNLVSARIA